MDHMNIWELTVKLEISEKERPREGWKVYEQTPQGEKPITSRRGRVVKFRKIKDAFRWAGENRQGYLICFDGHGYGGLLRPEKY